MADLPNISGTNDITLLRKMLDDEKRTFEASWNPRDAALRLVEKMAQTVVAGNITFTGYAPTVAVESPEDRALKGLTESVRKAVSDMGFHGMNFNVSNIESYLKSEGYTLPEIDPRGRIAMVLQNLRENQEVVIVDVGAGRKPHTYKFNKAAA